MADTTYSTVADLLLGDMPVAISVNKQKFVNDAADEVDTVIGTRYTTPIDMTEAGPVQRPARLFVKRVTNHLATGRMILALAAGGEDVNLHAYGWSLVNGALAALESIANGSYDLPGATPITTPGSDTPRVTAPTVTNVDAESGVEAFYGYLTECPPVIPLVGPYWKPGS